jgi:hypothetical protein
LNRKINYKNKKKIKIKTKKEIDKYNFIKNNLKKGNTIINDNGNIYIKYKNNKNIKSSIHDNITYCNKNIFIYKKYNIEDYRNCINCNTNIFSSHNLCNSCISFKIVFDNSIRMVKNMKNIFYKVNILNYNKLLNAFLKNKIDFECINYNSKEYNIIKMNNRF